MKKRIFFKKTPYILFLLFFIIGAVLLFASPYKSGFSIFEIILTLITIIGLFISTLFIIISEFKNSDKKDKVLMIVMYVVVIASTIIVKYTDFSSSLTLILTIIFDLVIKEYYTIKRNHDFSILSLSENNKINKDYYELYHHYTFSTIKLFCYLNAAGILLAHGIQTTFFNDKSLSLTQSFFKYTLPLFMISAIVWCLIVIFLFKSRNMNKLFNSRLTRQYENVPSNLCQFIGEYSEDDMDCLKTKSYKSDLKSIRARIVSLYSINHFENGKPKPIKIIDEILNIKNTNHEYTDNYDKIIVELERIKKSINIKSHNNDDDVKTKIDECISALKEKKGAI